MGYFNLINGYKTQFVCGRHPKTSDHIYLPNTSIEQLNSLKKFDDNLRLLLKYITQIEEEVRTLAALSLIRLTIMEKLDGLILKHSNVNPLQTRMSVISSAYSELSRSKLNMLSFIWIIILLFLLG